MAIHVERLLRALPVPLGFLSAAMGILGAVTANEGRNPVGMLYLSLGSLGAIIALLLMWRYKTLRPD